jgi:hypothetical protein
MPLFEMTSDSFRPIEEASFAELKVRERGDLQRLLRSQIEVVDEDLYVIAEEFGEWDESRRRIDLLAIDRDANLVVIELKRTADGGHMELQAIRYAAMVSEMTFKKAVQIHADFLAALGKESSEAKERILSFLGWDEPFEDSFGREVGILLVAEDFSKELTSTVLWLRKRDLDIRCVRMQPYSDGGRKLINVQQVIPLPEAQDYQIRIREKEQVARRDRAERYEERLKFWGQLVELCKLRNARHADRTPNSGYSLSAASGKEGLSFDYLITQYTWFVRLSISMQTVELTKTAYDQIAAHKLEIESAFGSPLSWDRLDDKLTSCVRYVNSSGGYLSPESEWPSIQAAMMEAMDRLEKAVLPVVYSIDLEVNTNQTEGFQS